MAGGETIATNTLGLGLAVCLGGTLTGLFLLLYNRCGTDGDGYVTGALETGRSGLASRREEPAFGGAATYAPSSQREEPTSPPPRAPGNSRSPGPNGRKSHSLAQAFDGHGPIQGCF